MQISEMLSEVKLTEKRKKQIDSAVSFMETTLKAIKSSKKYELQDSKLLAKLGVPVPISMEPPTDKGRFQFLPPSKVVVSGSYGSDVCTRPGVSVDLMLEMPKECFDSMDYLNQRYIRKRAIYLVWVAKTLKKHSEVTDIKFTHHHGNCMRPLLAVTVKIGAHKPVVLHLHAVAHPGVFKLNRFHANKNNVRSSWCLGHSEAKGTEEKESPTPFYNSCILEDIVYQTGDSTLQEKLTVSSPGLKEGIMLLKVWLRQRGLNMGYGSFSNYLMTMYVVHLLEQKKLSTFMSSYQVFRNTLLRLSQSSWTDNGISMCAVHKDVNMPLLSDFHQHFEVVFVDPTGYLNMAYTLDRSVYNRVKHEAVMALSMLDNKHLDSFDKLFIKKMPFNLSFDHMVHISLGQCIDQMVERLDIGLKVVDHGGDRVGACQAAILSLLERSLRQRVTAIQLYCGIPSQWDMTDPVPRPAQDMHLTYGLSLDQEHAFSILDKGPEANTPMAAEFRLFWGDKCELRRFQDGGICEAVLWMADGAISERQQVCDLVIKHTLARHASISGDHVQYIGGQLNSLLHLPVKLSSKEVEEKGTLQYGTGEEQITAVMTVYDSVCKLLRQLPDLPLTINTVQGASACFRFTEVFPPLPCTFRHPEERSLEHGVKRYIPVVNKPCPPYTHLLKVVCTLEGSGKWPDNLDAMRRLKAAFHLQLAQALRTTFSLPTRVGVGHVDIVKDHYVFRLVLCYTREISQLRSLRTTDGKLVKRDTEEALVLERETIALPRLTSTLHGLQQQHSCFCATARLAKRWVSSHMLADYIHPVAVELIVAHLFLSPAPYSIPRSGLVGFQRFLDFLSSFDWKTSPLLINLNSEFTDADLIEIPTKFSKERPTLPLMFISTPLDKYSQHWTKHEPSPAVLTRLVLLAAKSAQLLQHSLLHGDTQEVKVVFRPSLTVFDVLIYLNENQLPRKQEGLSTSVETISYGKSVDKERFPVTEFDPARLFLQDLKDSFSDVCLFFHDQHGGDVIGLIWKPNVFTPKEFKVSHVNHTKLDLGTSSQTTEQLMVTLNVDAVIEDIKVLGKGIVRSIELNKKPA
ncbi:nucleolar protein 6-like isoform X9 [Dreissena polymorpha]|nr:nucleolar protein 6-like isoform X2 [Dreissena polymorpha]XP_052280549.1 nucleolar protein 6-like isoform X3 [Dreissena polymorpha]XP_052280550.1 nucleolar protein 6-like isoform X4 [Dreissena polymorpha]XP_052280551.1 nucleolar protein 6-like isoform X5 [Dreissena polymorpha]XP_052280552.1 nucleolar protein 6-like isoform X6 [Dreissena polymorpha]XP_052280553.1 nucleolar protein 6-like isoform X7 [Dreissena polymorpha]XP_052280554.1 nucleolar protein 6-like isoform X8 [Dreissena polymorph